MFKIGKIWFLKTVGLFEFGYLTLHFCNVIVETFLLDFEKKLLMANRLSL